MYHIDFDFDAKGEPPKVFICEESGSQVVEVLEEPICKTGGKLVEETPGLWAWEGEWSWAGDDWEPGPLAQRILALMNE